MADRPVVVVGGGLAGSEAAWQLARRGVPVRLYEMRPQHATPVHRSDRFAELVCSNSLKSTELSNPHGLLKAEMDRLGSLILECARRTRVPAGAALAVDREAFAEEVTGAITREKLVEVVREEVTAIPADDLVILAVGPLVSESLAADIARFTGEKALHFFDAIAPVVEAETIDRSPRLCRNALRQGHGRTPPSPGRRAVQARRGSPRRQKAPPRVDSTPFSEGCLPIEDAPRKGHLGIRPMRPVGH